MAERLETDAGRSDLVAYPLLPAVHLDQGRLRELPKENAAEALAALARKHTEAVVVDAQGLAVNKPDLTTIQRAARSRSVWVDAGSRTVADVSDLFIAGATRVTARWNTLADLGELEEAAEMTEDMYLGVEVGADFVRNPRERLASEKLAEIVGRLALPVVLIDLSARGAASDRALACGDQFAAAPERWYMGVVEPDAARALEARGYAGAILPAESLGGD